MRLHEAVVVRDFIAAIGGNPPVVEDRVMSVSPLTREHLRLREITRDHSGWRRWGPYLSKRSWGTVREDYSPDGEPAPVPLPSGQIIHLRLPADAFMVLA